MLSVNRKRPQNSQKRQPPLSKKSNTFPEVLTTARFYLELTLEGSSWADAYFMECKGVKYSQDAIEICEVAPQNWGAARKGRMVRTKIPGSYKVGNLSLKRGMLTQSSSLWDWLQAVQTGKWGTQRRDGALVIYEQGGKEGARFNFFRAWPLSYSFGGGNVSAGELAIEELELAIEDIKRVKSS
ncbi:MAG: phage tail protein [Leptolyngbyaceae cyanobacterium bins.59]|nr:phage tail protein [Leptolyngbyaceae cyanobacterium bins.59]